MVSQPWTAAKIYGHPRTTGVSTFQLIFKLSSGANGPPDKHSETQRQHLPDAAAVYCLQGKLWHAHKDLTKAVDCYVEALKLNPFMWDAFLGLCETGMCSSLTLYWGLLT